MHSHNLTLLKKYSNDPNAYATLQNGLEYFYLSGDVEKVKGYIAYARVTGWIVVLGNPVVSSQYKNRLLKSFIENFPKAIFAYITKDIAIEITRINKKARSINMWIEHWIDLRKVHTFEPDILSAVKKSEKFWLFLKEINWDDIPEDILGNIHKINDEFLAWKTNQREKAFITRSLSFTHEEGVRVFLVHIWGESIPIGIINLDPWYEEGMLIWYQLHQCRLKKIKLWWVYYSIVHLLIKLLSWEKFKKLSLGACQNLHIDDYIWLRKSKEWEFIRKTIVYSLDKKFSLWEIAKKKMRFSWEQISRYLLISTKNPIPPLASLTQANHMLNIPIHIIVYPFIILSTIAFITLLFLANLSMFYAFIFLFLITCPTIAYLEKKIPFQRDWLSRESDLYRELFSAMVSGFIFIFFINAIIYIIPNTILSTSFNQNFVAIPIFLQVLVFLFFSDLLLYILHRFMHKHKIFWKIHKKHHQETRLYWLNVQTVTLLDGFLCFVVGYGWAFIFKIPIDIIVISYILTKTHLFIQHANLNINTWFLSPFLATTEFHRWHHHRSIDIEQSNYGHMFWIWDVIFHSWTKWAPRIPYNVGVK